MRKKSVANVGRIGSILFALAALVVSILASSWIPGGFFLIVFVAWVFGLLAVVLLIASWVRREGRSKAVALTVFVVLLLSWGLGFSGWPMRIRVWSSRSEMLSDFDEFRRASDPEVLIRGSDQFAEIGSEGLPVGVGPFPLADRARLVHCGDKFGVSFVLMSASWDPYQDVGLVRCEDASRPPLPYGAGGRELADGWWEWTAVRDWSNLRR